MPHDSIRRKEMDCEVKVIKKKNGTKIYRFIGSTEAMDRGGDIVDVKGWDTKAWESNPVILFGHNHSIPAIGRGTVTKKIRLKQLIFDVEFAPKHIHPFAGVIEGLVENGFMKAVSVGFLPRKGEEVKETDIPEHLKDSWVAPMHFKEQELLELSVVNVGMNSEALSEDAVSSKSLGDTKEDILSLVKNLDKMESLLAKQNGDDDEDEDEEEDDKAFGDDDDEDEDDEDEDEKAEGDDEEGDDEEEDDEDKAEDDDEEDEEEDEDKAEGDDEEDEEDDEEDEEDEKAIRLLEFDRDVFKNREAVESWLSTNGYESDEVKERELFYTVYQRSKEEFIEGTFKTTSLDEGVFATKGSLRPIMERFAARIVVSQEKQSEIILKAFIEFTSIVKSLKAGDDSDDSLRGSEQDSVEHIADEHVERMFEGMMADLGRVTGV
jgi:hypothetical protein